MLSFEPSPDGRALLVATHHCPRARVGSLLSDNRTGSKLWLLPRPAQGEIDDKENPEFVFLTGCGIRRRGPTYAQAHSGSRAGRPSYQLKGWPEGAGLYPVQHHRRTGRKISEIQAQ